MHNFEQAVDAYFKGGPVSDNTKGICFSRHSPANRKMPSTAKSLEEPTNSDQSVPKSL